MHTARVKRSSGTLSCTSALPKPPEQRQNILTPSQHKLDSEAAQAPERFPQNRENGPGADHFHPSLLGALTLHTHLSELHTKPLYTKK